MMGGIALSGKDTSWFYSPRLWGGGGGGGGEEVLPT